MHVPVSSVSHYNCKYLTSFSCTVDIYLLSILRLLSANSEEVFPVYGFLLFYILSHGQQGTLNHAYFLSGLENETRV